MLARLIYHFISAATVISINYVADFVLINYNQNSLTKAAFDSFAHGASSGLCWLIVELESYPSISWHRKIINSVVCALLASLLDADHFIAAKSFRLTSALSLSQRPFFHNTTLMIGWTFILVVFVHFWAEFKWILFFFVIVWLPHHTRDANRRGFWLWPLGHTRPLPFWFYTSFIISCAYVVIFLELNYDQRPIKLETKPIYNF